MPKRVRFSKHAIKRVRDRFSGCLRELIAVIERGIFEKDYVRDENGDCIAFGPVRNETAKVVFVFDSAEDVTLKTAMWLTSRVNVRLVTAVTQPRKGTGICRTAPRNHCQKSSSASRQNVQR
jgi:hypothetical protein